MARDPWFDNVKMVLVTVVVVGHALVLVPSSERNNQIYDFVYLWHIPAFVLVTGYLSRTFVWTRKKLWALVTGLVVPYVVFEWAMYTFRTEVGGESIEDPMFLVPHWPMWYLVAVFFWRLATPILVKHWSTLPLSVVASLLFGSVSAEWADFLDLHRVVGLLPFFVLGLQLRSADLARIKGRLAPLVGVAAMVVLFLLAGHTDEWIATKWLWYSHSYDGLGAGLTDGMWNRLRVIMLGIVGSLAVLTLVPRRRCFLTGMGVASLVVYLCHGFFVRGAEIAGIEEWTARGEWTIWPVMAAAVLVAMLLAAPPVAARLNWLVDPIGSVQRARASRRAGWS